MAQALRTHQPSDTERRLLQGASVEVSPRDPGLAERLTAWFEPGTEVFVNFLPGTDARRSVTMAAALRRAGFEPVPHIAVRNLADRTELDALLSQLAGEAGVTKLLCIGGDVAVPRGAFASSLAVIESGRLAEHGITAVGIAGYPEGHHTLNAEALQETLAAKLAAAKATGLQPFVVTQFCFEAAPILGWLRALESDGIVCPVRIGVAGPTAIRTLLTFAMRCGVGTSLRMLLNQPQSIGRLLRDASPDDLLHDLADGLAAMPGSGRVALHLFPFGGLTKTGEWRRKMMG